MITLNGLDSNNNGRNNWNSGGVPVDSYGWGAYLDNCRYDWSLFTPGCTSMGAPKAVTLNGNNNFSNNFQDGLWVTSLGAIKVNSVDSESNGLDGAYLDNQWPGAVGGLTLTTPTSTSVNYFNGNYAYGLEAYSNGALTLSSIWAQSNIQGGASLDNCADLGAGCTVASGNVTLTGRNDFEGNGNFSTPTHASDGLDIFTDGAITINNLFARYNDGDGAYLDNCIYHVAGCTSSGSLTLTGMNDFSEDYNTGLYFDSGGKVSMTAVTSDQSTDGNGVNGRAQGSITLTCGSFNNNFGIGLYLSSPAVTLVHVVATHNGTNIITPGNTVYVRTCPLP
jgi:hypothetical protein